MLGTAEWTLAVNNPVFSVRLPNQFGKYLWASKWLHVPMKAQLAGVKGFLQSIGELTAEYLFQCGQRQQEFGVRSNPSAVVPGQSSGRNDAVDVRMMLQLLIPGMEHAEEADLSSEMLRVGGD